MDLTTEPQGLRNLFPIKIHASVIDKKVTKFISDKINKMHAKMQNF